MQRRSTIAVWLAISATALVWMWDVSRHPSVQGAVDLLRGGDSNAADVIAGALSVAGAFTYQAARRGVIAVSLLRDHPAALWPFVTASAFLIGAFTLDRAGAERTLTRGLIVAAGLFFAVTAMVWLLRIGTGGWPSGQDWEKDWAYYSAIQEAIRANDLPYYLRESRQGTDRLLAILEAPWAPWAVLLRWLRVETFYALQLLACVVAGYAGLARLRYALPCSMGWWAVGVVVFFINGHVLSHLGAGHTQWAAYFLLPWIFVGLVTPSPTASTAARTALVLTAMIALGGWHVFVWSYILVLASHLTRWPLVRHAALVSVMVGCLAAFRLVPAMVTFGTGSNEFLLAYETPLKLVATMIGPAGTHEYDMFIGWVGFGALAVGLTHVLGLPQPHRRIWVAAALLVVLSIAPVYEETLFRLPGFVSERVVTRLAIVGTLGFVLLGLSHLAQTMPLRSLGRTTFGAMVVAGVWLAVQLSLHAETLRPVVMGEGPTRSFLKTTMPIEPVYWWAVWAGHAVSAAALGVWLVRHRLTRPAKLASAR